MIRLRTLGESIIEVDGVAYTPQFDTLFAALVYLTAERGRRVPRQALAELLWPNHDASKGRHCLRQLLYRLRTAGCPVEGGRDTLLLPESLVLPTFSAAPAAERLVAERAAGTLVIGPFLPGYVPPFSDALVEWLEQTRTAIDARVRRVLLEVAHAHKLRGEWDQVDVLAAEVLRIDPLNEEATLARAEATAMVGAKTEAVALLDRYMAELGPERAQLQLPAAVLRKRIAERFPARRYGTASDQVFVGRAQIMERLSTALLRARKSEGSGILLTGAPGIGKTRLLQELTRIAAMQGVRVVRANITESDTERPLAAFADLVPQLRTLQGAIGVSPESLRFLDRLTEDLRPTTSSRHDTSDPRWVAARIRQAVVDLCDAVSAEHTVLVTIEDVHWLDSSSWAVVDALLEGIASKRMLLLLTSRGPHPTPATPLRCVERLEVLGVAGLEPESAIALARAIAADRDAELTTDTLRWCVSAGEGNPLFLRELIAHVLESGSTGSVPASIQGLLDARILRLSSTSRRVLESTVILGEFSTAEMLHGVLELPAHELASALSELAREQLLGDDPALISPRHELVQRRVLRLMPEQVARVLHRRAATILSESMAQAPTVESLLAAAIHWQNAQDASRAINTLSSAATAVERIGAVADSARLLEAALRLTTTNTDRIEISRRLLRCLAMTSHWTRLLRVVDSLAAIPEWRADADSSAADLVLAIQARYRTGEDSPSLVERTYEIASDATLSANTRVGAARLGVVIATNCGTHADQRRLWQSISSARLDSQVDHLELSTIDLIVEANTGDPHIAIDRAEELRALARKEADPVRRVTALLNVAQAYAAVGLLEDALHELTAIRVDAQRVGSADFEAIATHRITSLLIDLQRTDAAKEWFERLCQCVSRVSPTDSYLHRIGMIEDSARLALSEKRVSDALELAREFYEAAHSVRHPMHWHLRDSVTLLVETLLHWSESPIDDALITELEGLCTLDRPSFTHDRSVAVLSLALERSGRGAEAARIVNRYRFAGRRSLAPWKSPVEIAGLPQPVRVDP